MTIKKNIIDKRQLLIAYSKDPPECRCCSEKCLDFLQLDHIHDDAQILTRSAMYYLIKRQYPNKDVFQVLCANCNFSKKLNHGFCMHHILVDLRIKQYCGTEAQIQQYFDPIGEESKRIRTLLSLIKERISRQDLLKAISLKKTVGDWNIGTNNTLQLIERCVSSGKIKKEFVRNKEKNSMEVYFSVSS